MRYVDGKSGSVDLWVDARGWTVTASPPSPLLPSPNSVLWYQVINMSNDINRDQQAQTCCGSRTFSGSGAFRTLLCVMEEILYGSIWCMISPLLTTDDAVMLISTVTCRWNGENRHGALGYAFFMMLKLDQYKKVWHLDSDGNRVCTLLRMRNPFMEGIRRDGLQLPRKEIPPGAQEEVDLTSFGNAVMALMRDQAAEALLHQESSAWGYTEIDVDNASVSSGSSLLIWRRGDMAAQKARIGTMIWYWTLSRRRKEKLGRTTSDE